MEMSELTAALSAAIVTIDWGRVIDHGAQSKPYE